MPEPLDDDLSATPSAAGKAWPVAFGVAMLVIVVLAVVLGAVLVSRGSGSNDASTTGTSAATGSATSSTTSASTTTSAQRSARTSTSTSASASSSTSAPAPATSTSLDSAPSSSASEPLDLECSPVILRKAIDPAVIASDGVVSAYGCTPSTAGDVHDAYAWARVTAPNVNDVVVLYSGYVGTEPTKPMPVEWTVLTVGSAVSCQQFIPVASCDMLPGVPR